MRVNVLWVSILALSTIFLFDIVTVPTVLYILFHFIILKLENYVPSQNDVVSLEMYTLE